MTPHVNPQDGLQPAASAVAVPQSGKAFTARTALVIWTLMVVNALAQFDRQLVAMMAESLKAEFSLADWQLGLMTGFSFAVLYGAVSLPIAYMSDRTNRMQVIAACVGLGGLFIAFAGAAQTFIQLFLARVVVGGAEAGGSAASQSLIGSLARRDKRATALGVYGAGIPVGTFVGLLVGGMVIDSGDWRTAVAIAGVTGLTVSLALAVLSRGAEFAPVAPVAEKGNFWRDVREVFRSKAFCLVAAGGGMITFVNFGQSAFLASFFLRLHGDDLKVFAAAATAAAGLSFGAGASLGLVLGVAKGVPGLAGGLWGGVASDKLTQRSRTWLASLPAIVCWLRIPAALGAFFAPSLATALTFVVMQAFIMGFAGPAGYASIQWVAQPRLRALSASVYVFVLNVVGLGLGPLVFGAVSDMMQAQGMSEAKGLQLSLAGCSVVGLTIAGYLKWLARKPMLVEAVH